MSQIHILIIGIIELAQLAQYSFCFLIKTISNSVNRSHFCLQRRSTTYTGCSPLPIQNEEESDYG